MTGVPNPDSQVLSVTSGLDLDSLSPNGMADGVRSDVSMQYRAVGQLRGLEGGNER